MKRGFATYGHAIGILVLDTTFARIPGDIGNATTFDFPVLYRVVRKVPVDRLLRDRDDQYLPELLEAARELEAQGVRAITTSCGCLALYQPALAAAVRVPVFTSTLVQVPLVHRLFGPLARVGILAADARLLSEDHFRAVGWSSETVPIALASMHESPALQRFLDGAAVDPAAIETEAVAAARALLARHPDVRALVVECTNLVPYAAAVQAAVELPIFDIVTLTRMVHQATVRRSFTGYL